MLLGISLCTSMFLSMYLRFPVHIPPKRLYKLSIASSEFVTNPVTSFILGP
jgi:hypothetical protein